MEENPREGSLYYVMNQTLRDKDRDRVKPWRKFIWLLLHSLQKLPPMGISMTVYRGCKSRLEELFPGRKKKDSTGRPLIEGEDVLWSGFSSMATTMDVM